MKKETWRIWICNACGSETKLNYVADNKSYERIKVCHCGKEMQYEMDMEG